jgi:hypothetical protein
MEPTINPDELHFALTQEACTALANYLRRQPWADANPLLEHLKNAKPIKVQVPQPPAKVQAPAPAPAPVAPGANGANRLPEEATS